MTTSTKIPWYLKMTIKIFLARIPLPHKIWNKLKIFEHGKMQDFSYAKGVFINHLTKANLFDKEQNNDKVAMEIGPGESLFSALLAKSFGFNYSFLVDVGDFSLPGVEIYRNFAEWLAKENLPCPSIVDCSSKESMLSALNAKFLTNGLYSLKSLPANSVDFIFSHAVLEHIRKNEFKETAKELWRILTPGGVSTHVVDFQDHLENSLNNLRFSELFWESKWISSSGFYTNRIQPGDMIHIFESQGFKVDLLGKTEWKTLPIPKKILHANFKNKPDSELIISGMTIRLSKPG